MRPPAVVEDFTVLLEPKDERDVGALGEVRAPVPAVEGREPDDDEPVEGGGTRSPVLPPKLKLPLLLDMAEGVPYLKLGRT
eukprot:COSAG01_NODE_2542_length_7472_cov_25.428455_11_plen_81_part_00